MNIEVLASSSNPPSTGLANPSAVDQNHQHGSRHEATGGGHVGMGDHLVTLHHMVQIHQVAARQGCQSLQQVNARGAPRRHRRIRRTAPMTASAKAEKISIGKSVSSMVLTSSFAAGLLRRQTSARAL